MKGIISSFSQIFFFILFQIGFRLVAENISLYPKILLFLIVDIYMVMIAVFEWFNSEVEWQTWVMKVFV